MDYSYCSIPPQPYFMCVPKHGFAHGVDPESICSIEDTRIKMEPLKADVLPGMYDAFCFGHVIPTTYNPPDPGVAVTSMQVGSVSCETGGDVEDSQTSRTRSSNKEREEVIMHAQSRRKAQNRVSQRAFRERKERHMRDLEAELLVLKSSTYSLQSDNKRLKLALQRSWSENGNLRAIAGQSPAPLRRFSADSIPGYASVQSG